MAERTKKLIRSLSTLGRSGSSTVGSNPKSSSNSNTTHSQSNGSLKISKSTQPPSEPVPKREELPPINIPQTKSSQYNQYELQSYIQAFQIYEKGLHDILNTLEENQAQELIARKSHVTFLNILDKLSEDLQMKIPALRTVPATLQGTRESLNSVREHQVISRRAIESEALSPLDRFLNREMKYSREQLGNLDQISQQIVQHEKKPTKKSEIQLEELYRDQADIASKIMRNLQETRQDAPLNLLKSLSAYVEAKETEYERSLQEIRKFAPQIKSAIQVVEKENEHYRTIRESSLPSEPLVLGIPVETLYQREGNQVPRFLTSLLDHIRQRGIDYEGLFRKGAENKVEEETTFDLIREGKRVDWNAIEDINVAATVCKQFFQQMPEPLLTFGLYQHWIVLMRQHSTFTPNQIRNDIEDIVAALPESNKAILCYLMAFLSDFSQASKSNQMPAENLAIIFGPCLIHAPNQNPAEINYANKVIRGLIECTTAFGSDWVLSCKKSSLPTPKPYHQNTIDDELPRSPTKYTPRDKNRSSSVVSLIKKSRSIFGKGPTITLDEQASSASDITLVSGKSEVLQGRNSAPRSARSAPKKGPTTTQSLRHTRSRNISSQQSIFQPPDQPNNRNTIGEIRSVNGPQQPTEELSENQSQSETLFDKQEEPSDQNGGTTSQPRLLVKAKHNFVAQSEAEISFQSGDLIYVHDKDDSGWWVGEHQGGQVGWFPSTFVTPQEEIPHVAFD